MIQGNPVIAPLLGKLAQPKPVTRVGRAQLNRLADERKSALRRVRSASRKNLLRGFEGLVRKISRNRRGHLLQGAGNRRQLAGGRVLENLEEQDILASCTRGIGGPQFLGDSQLPIVQLKKRIGKLAGRGRGCLDPVKQDLEGLLHATGVTGGHRLANQRIRRPAASRRTRGHDLLDIRPSVGGFSPRNGILQFDRFVCLFNHLSFAGATVVEDNHVGRANGVQMDEGKGCGQEQDSLGRAHWADPWSRHSLPNTTGSPAMIVNFRDVQSRAWESLVGNPFPSKITTSSKTRCHGESAKPKSSAP